MSGSIAGKTLRTRALRVLATLVAAMALLPLSAAMGADEFGVKAFDAGMRADAGGEPYTQAGGHPYTFDTRIMYNTAPSGFEVPFPVEDVKDVTVDLPSGTVGNPTAMPTCATADFYSPASFFTADCPEDTQIGIAWVDFGFGEEPWSLYNIRVGTDETPALLGFSVANVRVLLEAKVRSGGDYGVTIDVKNISQGLPLAGTMIEVWGVPADSAHDKWRCKEPVLSLGGCMTEAETSNELRTMHSVDLPRKAYMTQATSCTPAGQGQVTNLEVASWPHPDLAKHYSLESHLPPGYPLPPSEWGPPQGPTGCENVPFEPSFSAVPTTSEADAPSGLNVEISMPQQGISEPDAISQSHLRDVTVKLPAGMSVNPASADGLGSCSPAQIGLGSTDPASCPDSSKIGTVQIDTPVLRNPLIGSVYLAAQRNNPFGSLLALYLVAEGSGVVVKLPGEVKADPSTGQLTSTFLQNPQLPFEKLSVKLKGGPRAPLMTPATCGAYSSEATLTPWSGNAPVNQTSSFQITSGPASSGCPNDSFDPKLSAGTTSPIAGTYSPFVLELSRADGTQQLKGITAKLPKGLLGKLAGIPYCPDSALASISGDEGTGQGQIGSPACPAASQVADVTVSAGAGSLPLYVKTGKAYLAGPYKGAPLSLAISTPAVAGPFDLGTVLVRTALHVNPETTEITAVSDPLPTILHGIPLDLRSVEVDMARSQFTLNPTSCAPMAIETQLQGAAGGSASPSSHFQVGGCADLPFKPRLDLRLKGPTKRAKYPALEATLTARPGDANIGKAQVTLPHSAFLAQEHIRTVCTRVQFAADQCPPGSVYGYAKAITPLLDQPLEGPVYLRSSSNKLPDLVAALRGQIEVDLVGRIDSKNGGIRNTFEMVPDAPVTKFTLQMPGGRKSLIVNSRNLCKARNKATVLFDGQNGKTADSHPAVKNDCRKQRKTKKARRHKRSSQGKAKS